MDFLSIFQLVILIFSVVVHEISHGFMAERLGDPTARLAGRLTLNPIRHIDPFGSILLPLSLHLIGFPIVLGWAKPVPYNPYNLYKDYQYGPLKVALVGPASNFLLLLVFGLLARAGGDTLGPVAGFFGLIALMNAFLAVFNLIPIPPLDGSKLLTLILPQSHRFSLERLGMTGIILVVFFFLYASQYIYLVAYTLYDVVAGPAGTNAVFKLMRL